MKKFMISLALASFAMFSTAQETVSEVVVPTKSKSVVTNSFGIKVLVVQLQLVMLLKRCTKK